ncbi:hypothetical protein PAE9249_03900 [Paenibacillus sp. CECT 9249]|uniref:DUF4391 domain-containing protein n=1 Tax=Paenibacillus sp. CECT 9249 TaxID=2845385 RepID=UPI001E5589CD|nr:DUF4391 domain-containing protein [Paenibacillus sp. CECT 9249]CAH0121372.1 hypothetical protein PAE9249_03900 [Paenibacillus sp. CECT 9249]
MMQLPSNTLFNRKIPKNKFYEKLHANQRLKDKFVHQVESITWKHKLSKETIRLEPRDDIVEIQIFEIRLKQKSDVHDILKRIDQAIPYPILHILLIEDDVKLAIAYKEKHKQDEHKYVVRSYYESEWQPAQSIQFQVIQGLDLKAVYENMIRQLLTIEAKPSDELQVSLERQEQIEQLSKACDKLKKSMLREKQFDRKVALNIELQKKQKELDRLLEENKEGTSNHE